MPEFGIDARQSILSTKAMKRLLLLSIVLGFCLATTVRSEVRLPALFSDNMVLQQGMDVPVWGWADDGEEVKVTFRGKTAKTKAKGGKWVVKLGKFKAGGNPDVRVVE